MGTIRSQISFKIASWFPVLLSLRYQPLFYFFIFIFQEKCKFFRNNPELCYDIDDASPAYKDNALSSSSLLN